ncbi:MAG TPA: SMP-30/gluconolactonase/LRE family protein, partial [Planctomycetaceae bacterium]
MSFFEPPKVIKSEVFATVPEKFRKGGGTAHGRKKPHSFLEGPSFDRDGNLYVTDIPHGRIFRVSPKGEMDVAAEYDGEPNGLKIHKDGRIFIADHKNGIMLMDPKTGGVTPHVVGPDKERFKGVNDLVFASNGDLYFTDQGQTGLHDPTGRVYRLTPEGRLDCLLSTVPSPNGIVPSRSERALFVAATRANAVWLVPLTPRGGVSKVGLFVQLPCPGPDGMALDEEGNLAVAHPSLGVVWLFNTKGVPLYRVESCAGSMVTNIAYGGEGRRFLYMTESQTGTVMRA